MNARHASEGWVSAAAAAEAQARVRDVRRETIRAQGVEQSLGLRDDELAAAIAANTDLIAAERTRAEAAEAAVSAGISANTGLIAAERTRAEAAEQTVGERLSVVEQQLPTKADRSALQSEQVRARNAEESLSSRISKTVTKASFSVFDNINIGSGTQREIILAVNSILNELRKMKTIVFAAALTAALAAVGESGDLEWQQVPPTTFLKDVMIDPDWKSDVSASFAGGAARAGMLTPGGVDFPGAQSYIDQHRGVWRVSANDPLLTSGDLVLKPQLDAAMESHTNAVNPHGITAAGIGALPASDESSSLKWLGGWLFIEANITFLDWDRIHSGAISTSQTLPDYLATRETVISNNILAIAGADSATKIGGATNLIWQAIGDVNSLLETALNGGN